MPAVGAATTTDAGRRRTPATPDPLVAITSDGDLVLVDAVSGTVVRTVREGVAPDGEQTGLSVTPDRSAVYLHVATDWPGDVVRVSLDDGTLEDVGEGYGPAVSPDGRTLAYVSVRTGEGTEERGIGLVDLTTGETRFVLDDECVACERVLGSVTWSADGRALYVVAGWGDHPFGTDVVALDVTDEHLAPTVQAGRVVGPDRSEGAVPSGWHAVTTLPDGSLAVAGSEEPDGAPARGPDTMGDEVRDDASFLAVVDPATGDVVRKVTVPDVSASSLRASPDGRHVVFRGRAYDPGTGTWTATLRRWDVLTGTVEEVPRTDPLARGR